MLHKLKFWWLYAKNSANFAAKPVDCNGLEKKEEEIRALWRDSSSSWGHHLRVRAGSGGYRENLLHRVIIHSLTPSSVDLAFLRANTAQKADVNVAAFLAARAGCSRSWNISVPAKAVIHICGTAAGRSSILRDTTQ